MPRVNRARKDFKDFKFIGQELGRLLDMQPSELRKHLVEHPEDFFATLSGPDGDALFFTAEGERRFRQIAVRGLDAIGAARRKHFLPEIVEKLKAEFIGRKVAKFIISEENAHDLFDASLAAATAEHVPLVHFIPCSVVAGDRPPRFDIGPVSFVLSKTFLEENDLALRKCLDMTQGPQWAYEGIHRFFAGFHWVARVSVDACEPTVSQRRARKIAQFALDLFKLIVGSGRASNVRQGYDLGMPISTATLISPEPDRFSFSLHREAHDVALADSWHSVLLSSRGWKIAESVVETYSKTWDDLPEPLQRFLDGLTWHGEAVSDLEPQSRLVKFWIAIERVVCLQRSDNITRRAAVLTSKDRSDFENRFKVCQSLYGKRSSVIHGSAARGSEDFLALALSTENLSRAVLSSYLFIVENLRRHNQLTNSALKLAFGRLQSQFK